MSCPYCGKELAIAPNAVGALMATRMPTTARTHCCLRSVRLTITNPETLEVTATKEREMSTSFYNTISLKGEDLKRAVEAAESVDKLVLRIFEGRQFNTPSEIHATLSACGSSVLLTSVRRSMSDLTKVGALIKTYITQPGPFGKPEHVWSRA